MIKLCKLMLKITFVVASLWAIGFAIFIISLPGPDHSSIRLSRLVEDRQRDFEERFGVGVYTGGGGRRISHAMALFGEGIGERLLISGVNPGTSRETLQNLWEGSVQRFDCCVDLGLDAQTTKGNARELAKWVTAHNIKHIVLVTSEYHIPRALLETRARLKAVTIIAAPSRSGYIGNHGYPVDIGSFKVLSVEYSKYLFATLVLLVERF